VASTGTRPQPDQRPFDLLVVGDANPDLVLRGDVLPRFGQAEQLLTAADLVLGGSAAIVAAGAARLGLRTAMAARVGTDPFAEVVLTALTDRGVDVSAVRRDPLLPTGLTVVLSAPQDRAMLTLPGTVPGLRAEDLDDGLLATARHLHVGGWYLMPQLVAGTAELFRRARAAGTTTSLDTNWDPAERWSGVLELLEQTDVFLPNLAELLAVTGHDPPLAEPGRCSRSRPARPGRSAGTTVAGTGPGCSRWRWWTPPGPATRSWPASWPGGWTGARSPRCCAGPLRPARCPPGRPAAPWPRPPGTSCSPPSPPPADLGRAAGRVRAFMIGGSGVLQPAPG